MAAKAQAAKAEGAKAEGTKAEGTKAEGWKPSISDEKVKAATGRGWMGWFVILNKANAGTLSHKEIAQLIYDKGCPAGGRK